MKATVQSAWFRFSHSARGTRDADLRNERPVRRVLQEVQRKYYRKTLRAAPAQRCGKLFLLVTEEKKLP